MTKKELLGRELEEQARYFICAAIREAKKGELSKMEDAMIMAQKFLEALSENNHRILA